jgi:hypothetical protein
MDAPPPLPKPPPWLQVARGVLVLQGAVAGGVGLAWAVLFGLVGLYDPTLHGDPSWGLTLGGIGLGLALAGLAVPVGVAIALQGGAIEARYAASACVMLGLAGPWLPFSALALWGLWVDEDSARFFALAAEHRAVRLKEKQEGR